jgi:hypothetical protein
MLCNYYLADLPTFACLVVFHFIFGFVPRVYLCLPPSSRFCATCTVVCYHCLGMGFCLYLITQSLLHSLNFILSNLCGGLFV